MTILLTSTGKLRLVGGQFLSVTPGTAPAAAPTQSLSITNYYAENPIAEPVFQRRAGTESDANGGNADVPVLFSYTGGAPVNLQARVVPAGGGTAIKDWTSLTSVQVNATALTGLGMLPGVPIGCKYLLEIRDSSQPTITIQNGTRKWGVGVCIILAGQSNMVSTLTAGSYNETIPGLTKGESDYWGDANHAGVYFNTAGFTTPWTAPGAGGAGTMTASIDSGAGGASAFVRIVSAGLTAKYGRKIPVCAVVWVFNGTGLGAMFPPGGNAQIYTNTGTAGSTIGWLSPKGYSPGDFEGILLHQGEAESGGITRPARVTDQENYYKFMLGLVAPYGRTAAGLFFRPAVLGVYSQTGANGVPGLPNIENVRGAVYDLSTTSSATNGWTRVQPGWNCIDLDPADHGDQGLHFRDVAGGNPYQKWGNRRMVQAVLKELGCAAFSGMGPKISGVTRTGDVATVTVAHGGGTTLAGRSAAALSGWYANTAADFSGADIAVTAAIGSANTITVTFPAGTAYPAYVKYMGGKVGTMQSQHPDVSNPVYDNAQYPAGATGTDLFTGLPLQPTPDSWMVT